MKIFVNVLTLMRFFATLILPFACRFFSPIFLFFFVISILLTDYLDGMLARAFHVQSIFGTIMDVVADKFFGIMIILIIALDYPIFFIPLLLELGIAAINVLGSVLGAVTKSSFLGKTKMWFLDISIVLGVFAIYSDLLLDSVNIAILNKALLVLLTNIDTFLFAAVFIASGSEFMTAIDYARHIILELDQKEKIKYKFKTKKELMYVLFDTDYCLKHKDQPFSKVFLKDFK